MDQSRRLQSLTWDRCSHLLCRQLAEFVVNQRKQFLRSVGLARFDLETLYDLVRHVSHGIQPTVTRAKFRDNPIVDGVYVGQRVHSLDTLGPLLDFGIGWTLSCPYESDHL